MSKIRHADFYPDEFLVGVVGLNPAEIGAYWVACSLMYSRGGSITDDDAWISRACGCNPRTWRAIKDRLVAAGKLTIRDGFISNSRVIREIERAQKRLKQSRNAAEASANARLDVAEPEAQPNDRNDLDGAAASINDELSPTTNYQLTNHQPKPAPERLAFDAFVAAAKRHPRWPVPNSMSDARRKALRGRLKDAGDLDGFLAVLATAEDSGFICSEMTSWSLDWFLKPANFEKVRDGNYNNRNGAGPPQKSPPKPLQI